MAHHPSVHVQVELSGREFNVILAALRLYQYLLGRQNLEVESGLCERVAWIVSPGEQPTAEEVETLADRIN